ncbi:MAG: cold-shock protein [Nitriliruptorales bacterium]
MQERVIGTPLAAVPHSPADCSPRATGTVRWYSSEKGYGFIAGDDGVKRFVRYSDIDMEGFKELTEGQRVSFEVGDDGRGPVARDVCPL